MTRKVIFASIALPRSASMFGTYDVLNVETIAILETLSPSKKTGILDLKLTNVYNKTKLNFYVVYSYYKNLVVHLKYFSFKYRIPVIFDVLNTRNNFASAQK